MSKIRFKFLKFIAGLSLALCMFHGANIFSFAAETDNSNTAKLPLEGCFETHQIWSDGHHNAFTGAAFWKGKTYVVFRNAEHHVSFDGQVKILSSADGVNFTDTATISLPGKDLRDPKVVNAGRTLHLYVGAVDEKDTKRLETDAKLFTSKDGTHWKEQKVTGLVPGSWLWFVHYDGKTFYGSAYHHNDLTSQASAILYKSKNGKDWEPFFNIPVIAGNEVSLDTDANGALYALVRCEIPPCHPYLLTIPDLKKPGLFELRQLPFTLQGPFLKRVDGGCIVLGRRWEDKGWQNPFGEPNPQRHIEMIWLGDDRSMKQLCSLESGGDCSYTGWAAQPDGSVLISYYSGHGHQYPQANIYVAKFPKDFDQGPWRTDK